MANVRGAISELLNAIDDAKRAAEVNDRGVIWLDGLEERIEAEAREMDRMERADREEHEREV